MGLISKALAARRAASASSASAKAGHLNDFHPFAKKLPAPKRTGNSVIDGDNTAKCDMLKELLTVCLNDLSNVPPLFTKLRERQRAQGQASDDADFADVKQFRQLNADFLVNFAATLSDLSIEDIVGGMQHEPDLPQMLASFETQIPLSFRWSETLASKEITYRFMSARSKEVGDRLRGFKGRGGMAHGRLDVSKLCYELMFDDAGRLTRIKHCTGDVAEVGALVHIYRTNSKITENWSDMAAAVHMPPLPPVKLSSFFLATGNGPFKFRIIQKRSNEVDKMISDIAAEYDDDKKRAALSSCTAADQASQKLEELARKNAKARCKIAREKASAAMAKKKARKTIVL